MTDPLNEAFERTQPFLIALGKACNRVTAELDTGLEAVGINARQLGILLTLAYDNARSPAALAKLVGVDSGRMTRLLDVLTSRGLVERARSDKDRRVVEVSLTQEGWETIARSAQVIPEMRRRRFAHFTQSDFDALSGLVRKLLEG
ncbi:MarR family transcriptional regulator [Burkholderia sp. Ac-20345]|uniref:MarR family winged helix-turn-helix transcriptional regulator n=1 Tax=Burkholderia sp. Ac-20345 TaxID=2703891 RepID=UPI00197B26D5|nr:MarR family transcriptional regulator [Burkholderia sp. Ac-20345]MBN3778950.1 MarR family transcriptional regulator [Burkholderia sp. Ac-20345]